MSASDVRKANIAGLGLSERNSARISSTTTKVEKISAVSIVPRKMRIAVYVAKGMLRTCQEMHNVTYLP